MVLEILKEVDALLEGHFLLSSGNHSDKYCQCAKLFEHPEKSQTVVRALAEKLEHLKADLVVGPAMGGIIAAYELSAQLGLRNIFTERVDNIMTIKRGFEIKPGEKVIIMEDVITTGKSSMEVAEIINKSGGEVLALACIVDRSAVTLPYPVYSAVKLDIQAFEKQDCPLCKQGIPVVKPGSRKF